MSACLKNNYIKATSIKYQPFCLEHGQVNALSRAKFWIRIQPLIRAVILLNKKVVVLFRVVLKGRVSIYQKKKKKDVFCEYFFVDKNVLSELRDKNIHATVSQSKHISKINVRNVFF